MSILCTTTAPRKGQDEHFNHFPSSEFDSRGDTGDDETPDDELTETSSLHGGPDLPFPDHGPPPDLDPRGAVEAWKIAALGRRPRDYLARDLLLHSLWRDERPRMFHGLAKKPPAWVEDHVAHLPGGQDRQAAQLTALHYLHRRHLARLWTGDVVTDVIGAEGGQLLGRLWSCWPYGAKVEPPADVGTPAHGCSCRLAWLCPWCYARRAVRLERLLREGPLRRPQGKHLVVAWVATVGEQASPDPDWDERWGGRPGYYLQGPRKVRAMRSAVTAKLRGFARELGITGGVVTHQISPWNTSSGRRGVAPGLASFRHDYALLGEVTFADDGQRDRFESETAYRSDPFGGIRITHTDLAGGSTSAGVVWSSHPADDPDVDALRLFLVGSPVNYPAGRLDYHAGGLTEGRIARNGVRGALALQPHFMMDEVQWWSHAEATRGLPLYVPFGTWRSAIGQAKARRDERRRAAVLLPSSARIIAGRRRQVLKKANANRKRQARQELDRLLEVARPLLKQATAGQPGRRGRPAHRARLKGLLEQQGFTVSEHRLKQLARELGS
jgi:hypothetical protein